MLITEWMDSCLPILNERLGWTRAPRQVLPHEVQARRTEEDKRNKPARLKMAPAEYAAVANENALDLLLFEAVKRIFLERLHCAKNHLQSLHQ